MRDVLEMYQLGLGILESDVLCILTNCELSVMASESCCFDEEQELHLSVSISS